MVLSPQYSDQTPACIGVFAANLPHMPKRRREAAKNAESDATVPSVACLISQPPIFP